MPNEFWRKNRGRLQRRLLEWFQRNRRDLPWRRNGAQDPSSLAGAAAPGSSAPSAYRVWVAEIMLQQTRIGAVIPYYERFLENFPTVRSLAGAKQETVLRAWSGLGYYSRARNLHRAAQQIVAAHRGEFPRTREQALALPGIGRYTAAAILSIAYNVPLAALDGNVARVLARIGAIRGDLRRPRRWRQLENIAEHLLARKSPADWNQALMELGETICTPQSPRCGGCPILRVCRARSLRLTQSIPSARRKRAPVRMRIAAAILRDPRGRTILVRDPGAHDDVLFSRMWQFPAVEVKRDAAADLEAHLRELLALDSKPLRLEPLPAARHGVTFRNITLLPFLVPMAELPRLARTRILPLDRIARLPVSSATRKIAAAAQPAISSPVSG